MVDLRRLQVLREVATRGSFSAAALALAYTQSSVSEHVAALERELGVTLLDRSSRPVRPTHTGTAVLRHAESLLEQEAAMREELAALTRGDTGKLRVAAFQTAWTSFLPRAVAAHGRTHPAVELTLNLSEPDASLRALRAGEIDLAVTYHFDGQPDSARFQVHHLLDDGYRAVVPATHRLARRREVTFADLSGEDWVAPPPDNHYTRFIGDLCRKHGGFTPTLAYPVPDIVMAMPLIAAGLGVTLQPALSLRHPHPGVAVRPVAQAPARRVLAVWRAHTRTPTVAPMVAALREAASAP
jgi:DNA-binding transcriptional LysR family regulator